MNLIQDYESGSEGESKGKIYKKIRTDALTLNLTPDVDISQLQIIKKSQNKYELQKIYDESRSSQNHLTGIVDPHFMNNFNFEEQYHSYKNFGFAYDPSDNKNEKMIINKYLPQQKLKTADELLTSDIISKTIFNGNNKGENAQKKEIAKGRKKGGNAGSGDYLGPWAGYENEDKYLAQELTEEQKAILKRIEEKRKKKQEETKQDEEEEVKVESVYHGKEMFDYKGRSYILPPSDLKPTDHTCYIPKKPIHTWSGHTKGVQVIRFFPKFGHFILSGSLDTKIKIWDVNNDRKCVRTYIGHKEAVRDLHFTNDGLHFLSAGYDKLIHFWDTETGKAIKTFKLKKFPYCIRFNPDEDKQHTFLVGSSNKKIGQYDIRTGNRTQQYDEHLGAVNTITFIDNNRKFVSTSDDKKIFLWEFGIPVVVKHISEPEMHSITSTDMHPSKKYFAGQSADNRVVIYDAKGGNFRLNRKKKFTGHLSAGYAIGVTFSPDGQFLVSGDAEGKVWFWDWKTTKNYRTIQAHDGVCIGVAWHPIDPSRLATCGWDGTIRYWD